MPTVPAKLCSYFGLASCASAPWPHQGVDVSNRRLWYLYASKSRDRESVDGLRCSGAYEKHVFVTRQDTVENLQLAAEAKVMTRARRHELIKTGEALMLDVARLSNSFYTRRSESHPSSM